MTPRRRDEGLTALELLLAGAMTMVVVAAMTTVLIATTRVTREATVRSENSRELRGVAEVVTASLRVAVRPAGTSAALVTAKPDEVSFYALLNRTGSTATAPVAPTLVRYWWDATSSCLMQSRVVGTALSTPLPSGLAWSWSGTPVQRCAMTTTTPPAFRYFATPELTAGGSPVPDLGSPAGGLDAATRESVRSVEVRLVAQTPDDTSVTGSTVLDRVTLHNAS